MTDTSVRKRLARAAKRQLPAEIDANIESSVDAILAELADPSEGMLEAVGPMEGFDSYAYENDIDRPHIEWWRAMIQHIRSGGS